MSHADEEISSQPEIWRAAARLGGEVGALLPEHGARVLAVGCGTSANLARAYARLREGAGAGETDAATPSEVLPDRRYDHAVFFSRTGTTTETLEALRRTPAAVATSAVTATPGSPLGREAGRLVDLAFADEQAVIQTRFFTAVMVLLRRHLGADVTPLLDGAARGLELDLPAAASSARQLTFLGQDWTLPLAEEATLKCRETAQLWAEAHHAMEYRHGPISIAEPGVLVWCLGDVPAGLEQQVRATGAEWESNDLDPLVDLIRVQRLAVARAEAAGLDPDHPRQLTHSVVLDRALA